VRRAQEAVLSTRPFNEGLQSVFSGLVKRLALENIELPLLQDRPVKTVTVVVMIGDRGLCGGYNAKMIKLAEKRIAELKQQGLQVGVITIGNKGTTYFKSRTKLLRTFEMGQSPDPATAAAIAEELLSEYLSGEVDRVEFLYTRFINLITSEPSIRTVLPLKAQGIEDQADEIFTLTTDDGQLASEKTVRQGTRAQGHKSTSVE
jgi:F-type H+-transporting ATPase subunit gamma